MRDFILKKLTSPETVQKGINYQRDILLKVELKRELNGEAHSWIVLYWEVGTASSLDLVVNYQSQYQLGEMPVYMVGWLVHLIVCHACNETFLVLRKCE